MNDRDFAKRYLIFCFDGYYPSGGVADLVGQSDSIKGAMTLIESKYNESHYYGKGMYDFIEIVDKRTMNIVVSGERVRMPNDSESAVGIKWDEPVAPPPK